MITKKLLTLGLGLSIMSPLASYAGMGAESGGGGDAVVINGEAVLRDMVVSNRITKIKNNIEFMNSVPRFREMIAKIAEVRPYFATRVIAELDKVILYSSPDKLPVLPYSDTTIAGEAADVQLATRVNNEVILAPEFFGHRQAEYILLHEALHGLLADNAGPIHHQRVRTIVKYIHDNLNNLDANLLNQILEENNFNDTRVSLKGLHEFMWDENESASLKCYVYNLTTRYIDYSYINETFIKFYNLKCIPVEKNTIQDANLIKFVNERFSDILALQKKDNVDLDKYISAPYPSEFKLEKDSIFKKWRTKYQIEQCKRNELDIKEAKNSSNEINRSINFNEKVENVLSDNSVNRYEKVALVNALLNSHYYRYRAETEVEVLTKLFEEKQNDLKEKKEKVETSLQISTKQDLACKNQYPNL